MSLATEGKDEMGKRFAIVIGVAAAGVMALGAQTALVATFRHFEGTVEGGGRRASLFRVLEAAGLRE